MDKEDQNKKLNIAKCMKKKDKQDLSIENQKKPIVIGLDKKSEKVDYDKLVANNDQHPLVMASSEFLKMKGNCESSILQSNLDHNLALFQKGLSPHYGSRVNNVIPSYESDKLVKTFPHSLEKLFPMNRRITNILNLYRLKTGERKGCYLGANVFDFSSDLLNGGDQKYIATEAPYDRLDYYRMVIDSKSRILVSLTTDVDDSEKEAFPKIRNGIKTNIHHL